LLDRVFNPKVIWVEPLGAMRALSDENRLFHEKHTK